MWDLSCVYSFVCGGNVVRFISETSTFTRYEGLFFLGLGVCAAGLTYVREQKNSGRYFCIQISVASENKSKRRRGQWRVRARPQMQA